MRNSDIIKDIIHKINLRNFKCIWFRDDDVGKKSDNFYKLNKLFEKYNIQICYSVIPKLLCEDVINAIKGNNISLVFQHGYSHQNLSKSDKFAELSDAVDCDYLKGTMLKGKKLLKIIFGKQFKNILVPPYNNIDNKIQDVLKDFYVGCSTYKTNKTKFNKMFNPNCDIVDWENNIITLDYINSQIDKVKGDVLGILIHHKYLNEDILEWMEELLYYISQNKILNNFEEA